MKHMMSLKINYWVMRTMNKSQSVGKVLNLFTSKNHVDSLAVDKEGIIGDKFYAKDRERSVLISTIESYKMAEEIEIKLEFGKLGENLLIDYNPYLLEAGKQLYIGSVILEINQKCTLCKSLTQLDKRLPKLLKDDRGIFAKVIQSGTIYKDDPIYII